MKHIQEDKDELFRLWTLMRNASHIINRVRDQELRQHDITARQTNVLGMINRLGGEATNTEIARRMFRDPSTIFNIINVLHRKGYITKSRDAVNKHWVRLSLTDQGESVYRAALQREKVAGVMHSLSVEEREQFQKSLEILRDKGMSELGISPERR